MGAREKFKFAQEVITWCLSLISAFVNLFKKKSN